MNHVSITAVLTTGRTLKQGRDLERGKFSKEYCEEVSVCEMDSSAFQMLGIKEGAPILVKSISGSVIARSRIDHRGVPGIVFMPCGPYANMIIGPDTDSNGMPNFKGISVEISAAENRDVLSIEEILQTTFGGD